MSKKPMSELTTAELTNKLKTISALSNTTFIIFAVIVAAWVGLGYWRTNLPVFISTLSLAIVFIGSQFAIRKGISSEIQRRQADELATEADRK